jgi:glycerol-3-phosphate dehydrogenase subunit B
MQASRKIDCDLCIIGTGTAGMAATLFAVNRGLATVQVGHTGEIIFASGLFDLLGVHPAKEKKIRRDPWAGIKSLVRDVPDHPYARIQLGDIRTAIEEFFDFLSAIGLPYHRSVRYNSEVLTSMGTTKLTYGVPHTMWPGVEALKNKCACLLVDFHGLKGFSARQIVQTAGIRWPDLRAARIEFPEMGLLSEVYTERMALALQLDRNREALARAIRPHLNDAKIIGIPAVLGLSNTLEAMSDLEKRIGVPVFEIPSMPPSVSGVRLKQAFERHLPAKGVQPFFQKQVLNVHCKNEGSFEIEIGMVETEQRVRSKGLILATGRFIGQGLQADRKGIRETLLNLPVFQPHDRSRWHRRDFLDPRGHPINQAGLEIDRHFRVLDSTGRPAFKRLFAVGSILAHQDWIRSKCGSGLAIATAYGAVNSFFAMKR